MLVAIQVLRGVAALLVTLDHLPWARYRDTHPWFPSFAAGAAGVDLFFVLSGAVMMLASRDAAGPRDAVRFWARRAIRVLPLYWVATAVALLQFKADYAGGRWDAAAWKAVLTSVSLVPLPVRGDPDDVLPLMSQGWTLEYEVFFYLAFGLALIAAPRRRASVLGTALVLLSIAGVRVALPAPLYTYAKIITVEFVLGMAIGRAYISGRRLRGAAAAACVCLGAGGILAVTASLDDLDTWRGLTWGVPAALILAGLLCGPAWRETRLTRPLVALGDASYSLYLVHGFVYQIWYYVFTGAREDAALPPRWYAPMLVSAVLAAFPVYSRIERPMTRWLQRALLGAGRGVPFRLPRPFAADPVPVHTPAPAAGDRDDRPAPRSERR